jgi:hypothetical protein
MKKLLLILITALFTLSLFTGSENPGLPARALKDRPYYVADHELIAEIGGTPLYFDEFRYHAYTVLSELGLSTGRLSWFTIKSLMKPSLMALYERLPTCGYGCLPHLKRG